MSKGHLIRIFLLCTRLCALLAGILLADSANASGLRDEASRIYASSDVDDWPGYGRTYSEQHYSPLRQVDQRTIAGLGLEWFLDLSDAENSVTQPIAVRGVLYFASGHSHVHAVDANSGKLLWDYDAKGAIGAGLNLRMSWGSRGIAWWNGKIYTGTTDGRLIALDAGTGRPLWSVQTLPKDSAGYISGAPRAFAGRIIVGFGGDFGKNRGYVTAYDAETGRLLWRFFTVPGDPRKGFESDAMAKAAKTWDGKWWQFGGGGTVWNAIAYDAETDTVFIGVGEGYPKNRKLRSADVGDNLFTASIVALQGKSGVYKWHYQLNPGDVWDYDATMDIELADAEIAGRPRKVLLQAAKNGFFYCLDRTTGQLLSAEPYAKVTWAKRIDSTTGRPVETPAARYPNGSTPEIWPSAIGAHNWLPMAYSPQTRYAYVPAIEAGMTLTDRGLDLKHWKPSTDRSGNPPDSVEGAIGHDLGVGGLLAWDVVNARIAWRIPHPTVVNGGVLATAGDLVFQGSVDGTFKAYSATTGKTLWSFATRAPVIAPPISYAYQGRQYISLLTGLGTGFGLFASGTAGIEKYGVDPRSQARRVLTFTLGGQQQLPAPSAPAPFVRDPDYREDSHSEAAGQLLYEAHCVPCHGISGVSASHAPDLRRSPIPLAEDAFETIVRRGALVTGGMPKFSELSDQNLADLRQYIRSVAAKARGGSNGTHPVGP